MCGEGTNGNELSLCIVVLMSSVRFNVNCCRLCHNLITLCHYKGSSHDVSKEMVDVDDDASCHCRLCC